MLFLRPNSVLGVTTTPPPLAASLSWFGAARLVNGEEELSVYYYFMYAVHVHLNPVVTRYVPVL